MSEDDVAVVRANSQAFSDRDVERMLSYYAPDADVVDRRAMGLGSFRGHDELRRYYSSIFNSTDAMREHLEVLAARDGVVVAGAELWARLAGDTAGAGFTTPGKFPTATSSTAGTHRTRPRSTRFEPV